MTNIDIKILEGQRIRLQGVVDFPELYTSMKHWLEDMGYAEEKNLETKYIDKTKPDGKKQLEISWHGEKKVSEFFTYNIDTTILTLGMEDVEVQENGVKVKRQKAFFEIRVTSYIKSTDKWDELKGLKKFYNEMIIRKRINVYIEELYKKSTSYFSFIKEFMGLRD